MLFVELALIRWVSANNVFVNNATNLAFAVNLLGAVVGGALEYLSLINGYHVLLIVIGVLYGLAFVTGLTGRPAPRATP